MRKLFLTLGLFVIGFMATPQGTLARACLQTPAPSYETSFCSISEPIYRLFREARFTSHGRKPRISSIRFGFADTP